MSQFDKIRGEGRLLYEYIRGSHLYGLNTDISDIKDVEFVNALMIEIRRAQLGLK